MPAVPQDLQVEASSGEEGAAGDVIRSNYMDVALCAWLHEQGSQLQLRAAGYLLIAARCTLQAKLTPFIMRVGGCRKP